MLSAKRNNQAVKQFFRQALKATHNQFSRVINVDKNAAYPIAIDKLKATPDLVQSLNYDKTNTEIIYWSYVPSNLLHTISSYPFPRSLMLSRADCTFLRDRLNPLLSFIFAGYEQLVDIAPEKAYRQLQVANSGKCKVILKQQQ